MSPLERIDWLRRVRDAGAPLSAVSVAIECAFRDGGEGAWGSLGGSAIGERAARDGRSWLVAGGFLGRIHRAWLVRFPTPATGTTVPESGTALPHGNDDAGKRHHGAAAANTGTTPPESGTTVPPAPAAARPKTAPRCRRNGTTVPEKRHHGAAEQGLTGKERERGTPARRSTHRAAPPKGAPQGGGSPKAPRKPYEALRDELRRFGLHTGPAAQVEWGKLLQGPLVGARTIDQAVAALRWILTTADERDLKVRFARDAGDLAREWRRTQGKGAA